MSLILTCVKATFPNTWTRSLRQAMGFRDMESRGGNLRVHQRLLMRDYEHLWEASEMCNFVACRVDLVDRLGS